jgi:hypothetical protein
MTIRTKEDAQRVLKHVPDEKRFYTHDGSILSNLYELKTALGTMHRSAYGHHVSDGKNDFARWVRDVLGDDKLANDLMKVPGQKDAAKLVAARITWLQARA